MGAFVLLKPPEPMWQWMATWLLCSKEEKGKISKKQLLHMFVYLKHQCVSILRIFVHFEPTVTVNGGTATRLQRRQRRIITSFTITSVTSWLNAKLCLAYIRGQNMERGGQFFGHSNLLGIHSQLQGLLNACNCIVILYDILFQLSFE